MIRVLSLGGGVQSICIARMSFEGELPPLDHIIFADTGAELPKTYDHIEQIELEALSRGIGFHRVRNHYKHASSLYRDLMGVGGCARWASPPLFTEDGGQTKRQCTGDYKTDPIHKKFRALCGVMPRSRGPKEVVAEQWIGITTDEKERMKTAWQRWYRVWHPLIEGVKMNRWDCVQWFIRRGLPVPPKSACWFCPYQSDRRWIQTKRTHPRLFAKAVRLDEHVRTQPQFKGAVYLHASRRPLDDAIAAAERELERSPTMPGLDLDHFSDECHGVCGV